MVILYDNCSDCTRRKKRTDDSILYRLLRYSLSTYPMCDGNYRQAGCRGDWSADPAVSQRLSRRRSADRCTDVLLFFRDPINRKASEPNEMNLLRLCDVHNVPVATNIATAEALIMALERGDLDWREIGNPSI